MIIDPYLYSDGFANGEDGAARALTAVLNGKPYDADGMAPALVAALARVRALREQAQACSGDHLRADDVRRELLATTPPEAHGAIEALFSRITIPVGAMYERDRMGREIEELRRERDEAAALFRATGDERIQDAREARARIEGLEEALATFQQEIGTWAMEPEDPETLERWHLADREFARWVTSEEPIDPPDALTMVRAILFDHRDARTYWRERLRAMGQQESARLTEAEQERDELRLTLAAEQGKPEGAPSEGWGVAGGAWLKGKARVKHGGWSWYWYIYKPAPNDFKETIAEGCAPTARAAMLAADEATR